MTTMSGSSQKTKKPRTKASKSRPLATSTISQPIVEDARSSTFLSSFSPDAQLFAFVSLAVDKHQLRVFDVNTSQVVAEHLTNRTRITSLAWLSKGFAYGGVQDEEPSPLKKRKKVDATLGETGKSTHSADVRVLSLGLADGRIQIFSVTQGRIVKTLSHATRKSAVLAIADCGSHEGLDSSIWTSSSDGTLCMWDLRAAEILVSLQGTTQTPYTALAVRAGVKDGRIRILAARNTIHLLTSSMDSASSDDSDSENVVEVCTFSGHASAVKSLLWDPSSSKRFFSCAEDDRFVYVWETPDTPSTTGKLAASCPLDADVHQIDLCFMSGKQILLTLSSRGKITLSPVPEELDASTGTKNSGKHQVPTLLPRSTINLTKKATSRVHIVAATFLRDDPSKIRAALVSGGVRVAFETLQYLDSAEEYISEMTLKPSPSAFDLAQATARTSINNKRYSESAHIAVATGAETPHDSALDAIAEVEVEGALDADLAELSLGERLAARSDAVEGSGAGREQRSSGSDAEDAHAPGLSTRERRQLQRESVPAHSLTRTLIQALHAGDASLLEACLSHSDEALIRNTVVRLPSQLAVPLVNACVERLGRGARGSSIKGRGGGASAQRGMALIKWVRAVLTIHSGHLMTMPDLIARLSHLHSTLTTRLTLQDRLLSLSGRLDLVLSQVELRSSNAPAPYPSQKQKSKKRGRTRKEPIKYVEGESSEDEEEKIQVEMEGDDDEGSIEDVELGADIEDDSEEGTGDDSDEDEDEEDDGNLVNGFLDVEAEEDYEEDESEEDSD